MTGPADRDDPFERILGRAPLADVPPTTEDCLDAETLAAMVDDGLTADARPAAEAHVADCARCQATLAALVRTAPEPEPRASWWRLPAVRWLVPVVATGAAVAIWFSVDREPGAGLRREEAREVSPQARSTPSKRDAAVPAPGAPADAAKETKPLRQAAQGQVARDRSPAPQLQDRVDALKDAKASPRAEPAQQAGESLQKSETPLDRLAGTLQPVAQLPPPPPSAPPAAAASAAVEETAAAAKAAPLAAPRAGFGGRGGAAGNRVDAPASGDRLLAGNAARPAGGDVLDIPSPDPRFRWRLVGTAVQRSTDSGATWVDQPTGTTARITAGAAASPDVCWLVGDDGLVLVSVDGLSWQRLAPPTTAPLVSVAATAADAATVTTRDGRRFATTDRGRTWIPR